MINLCKRNLKVFFRQKSAVFFSLLGILIIIALYVLFLGNAWQSDFGEVPDAKSLMDSWIISGIVSVASITTTMGAAGTIVEDRARKTSKDFYSAPLKRYQIVGGYVFAIFIVGMIMSFIAFVAGEVYIVASGGQLLPATAMLKIAGIMIVSVLSSSSLVFFIVSFIRTTSAFMTVSTIIGSLIGFLTGIYLPIGTLPDSVQWLIKLFPVSHSSALMRQIIMEQPIIDNFAGIPESYEIWFKSFVGVTFDYGSNTLTPAAHLLILAGTSIVFFALALLNISKKES